MDDEYIAMYNSLNLEVAFIKKSLITKCEKDNKLTPFDTKSEQTLELLSKIQLLVQHGVNGFELYESHKKALAEPSINILYLLLTDACNLRCGYCYILSNMDKNYQYSMMKIETAISAINMFARCIKKSIAKGYRDQQIIIYGGEPTLNKQALLCILRYIETAKKENILPANISVTINTNGVLLDQEILELSKRTGAIIAISIDGPKLIHDQMRKTQTGSGSFDDVYKSYKLSKAIGAKTGVCITVDKHNLFKLTEVVNWLIQDINVMGMGFNILISNDGEETEAEYQCYSEKAAKQLIECFKIAREKGVYEDRVMRRVKCFIEKAPVLSDCGGCGLQLVVKPNGKIGVCQAFCGSEEYFVKDSFDTFEPENHPYWKEWRSRSPLAMDICKSCIALGNCGGGCPYSAYKRKGTIWALDERFCAHAKTTTEFLIRDLWLKQTANNLKEER